MNDITLKLKLDNSFFRFLLIGILNTIIGIGITMLLLRIMGVTYWAATFLGNSIGAINGYLLNRSFTFHSKQPIKESSWKYILIILSCYFISYGISKQIASYSPIVFHLTRKEFAVFLGAFLYTILNYIGQKKIVFKKE